MSPITTFAAVLALASAGLATNINVNQGCINVNNQGVCGGSSIFINGGSARIDGRFDGGNLFETAVPGCILNAQWPADYGDIYYGADNCIYDSFGQNINGQCCQPGTGGTEQVNNPYA